MERNKHFEDRLRELHDEVKEHPFWQTLSNDFHNECVDKLKKLMNMFISNFSRDDIQKCPQAVIILQLMHNIFDSILKAKIMPKYEHKTIMETKAFGNYIICLQTALQLIHYYLDDVYSERDVVGYEPLLFSDGESCEYRTYTALENGDGTYRLVQIITKDEVDKLAEWNKEASVEYCKIVKKIDTVRFGNSAMKKAIYYKEKYDDLIDNKEKYYIIK